MKTQKPKPSAPRATRHTPNTEVIKAFHKLMFALPYRHHHKEEVKLVQSFLGDTADLMISSWVHRRNEKRYLVEKRGGDSSYCTLEEAATIVHRPFKSFQVSLSIGKGTARFKVDDQLITVTREKSRLSSVSAAPEDFLRD